MGNRYCCIFLGLLLIAGSCGAAEMPVTGCKAYDQTGVRDDTFELDQTELVLIQPVIQTFTDENSQQAMDFSTMMDDWSHYASEITRSFEALQVRVVSTDKRYLIFTLGENQRMIFDSRQTPSTPDEAVSWQALLYRKGQVPKLIDITDNNMAEAKAYLGLK